MSTLTIELSDELVVRLRAESLRSAKSPNEVVQELVATLPPSSPASRPQVGAITSAPVAWSAQSFAALDESGMKELGLL